MIDERDLLEQALRRFEPEPGLTDRIYRRRDRKRRNQRITAGVVGIAVFIAAIWIVTSGGVFDRSETSVVPGGDVTGPAETGPTVTGPKPVVPDAGWDGVGLPPERAVPSTPEEGELVAHFLDDFGPKFVYVYADGRVITQTGGVGFVAEARLTPEGVDLARSGAILPEDLMPPWVLHRVSADVWEDPESKPFVPSRYAVCYSTDHGSTSYDKQGYEDPSRVVGFFPPQARAILRGEVTHGEVGSDDPASIACSEVTTDEARALVDILGSQWPVKSGPPYVRVEDAEGDEILWEINMILPHGVQVGHCSPNPCG
jgi:hypothetical protein